jgi:hypothetical protein
MNSHDARSLRMCCLCKTLGAYQPKNPGVGLPIVISIHSRRVPKKEHKYVHPICYLEEMGIASLLILDYKELQHIRMCDVPMYAMTRLLRVRDFGFKG